jgi:hypothetical protein
MVVFSTIATHALGVVQMAMWVPLARAFSTLCREVVPKMLPLGLEISGLLLGKGHRRLRVGQWRRRRRRRR